MQPDTTDRLSKPATLFVTFFAIAIQIQASFFSGEGFLFGLRLNLADVIIPFAGISILYSLLTKKSLWPHWIVPKMDLLLVILTLVIGCAFLNGYFTLGHFTNWAIFNRGVGWICVVSYCALGTWISTNCGTPTKKLFLKIFALFFLATAFVFTFLAFYEERFMAAHAEPWIYPVSGFMGNRNAFAFLTLAVYALITSHELGGTRLIPRKITLVFWMLASTIMLYNGSRAGICILPVLSLMFAIVYRKNNSKTLVICALLGVALAGGIYKTANMQGVHSFAYLEQNQRFGHQNFEGQLPHAGDIQRNNIMKDALALWKTSPITGIGIGSFLEHQKENFAHIPARINIIDSTPLWLLTETGIIGLVVFAGFYIFTFISLCRYASANKGFEKNATISILFIIIAMAVMVLVHELLFTRFLWLLLGIHLAAQNSAAKA